MNDFFLAEMLPCRSVLAAPGNGIEEWGGFTETLFHFVLTRFETTVLSTGLCPAAARAG